MYVFHIKKQARVTAHKDEKHPEQYACISLYSDISRATVQQRNQVLRDTKTSYRGRYMALGLV